VRVLSFKVSSFCVRFLISSCSSSVGSCGAGWGVLV